MTLSQLNALVSAAKELGITIATIGDLGRAKNALKTLREKQ